jgi:uncharacterized SAM-binding protein YcdF (DUF218 family)
MTPDAIAAPRHHRAKSFRIGAAALLAAVLLALVAGWLVRAQILRGVARAWVVSDLITPADAIAVLGGGLETRPFAAADLYKKGIAKQILLADVKLSPTESLKIIPSHVELNRAVLLKLDVPPEAIAKFGTNVSNTFEEARALADWAKANGIKSIIVPTEIFSSRRVRWILDKRVSGIGVHVEVLALSPPEYDIENWWRSGAGVIAFQNEVIKYLYYKVKY